MDLTTVAVYTIYRDSIVVCIGSLNAFKWFFECLAESTFISHRSKYKASLWIKIATRVLITKQW